MTGPDLTIAMPPHPPLPRRVWDRLVLWFWTNSLVTLIVLLALTTRRRFTHDMGCGGAGRLKIVDDPQFPDHDFFVAGREFPCRVRHSDGAFHDNATLVLRGASIKFADSERDSPFDLILNSVEIFPTATLEQFLRFIPARAKGGGDHYLPIFEKHPYCLKSSIGGVRRNPTSYSRVHFYSQVPDGFVARDGKPRLARFRMIPADRGQESGMPSEADIAAIPSQARLIGDDRPRDYLAEEFPKRVASEGVGYILQLQLHELKADDGVEVYDSGRAWDPATHPHFDLATIQLDRALSHEESFRTTFFFKQRPSTLPILPARSIYDFNSINHVRAATGIGRKARLFAARLFGLPERLPVEAEMTRMVKMEDGGPV